MKKYVVGLALLMMQNIDTMELDPLAMVLKNDEKCKLVAKYLHKYPVGKNKEEARKILFFLNDTRSEHAVLSRCVNKYKNMLNNMQAEKVLFDIHTENLLPELKQRIFTQVLWDYAKQYYVIYNTSKFVAMDRHLIPDRCGDWMSRFYAPCFLAEIHESNDQYIYFSKTTLPYPVETNEINDQRIYLSDFDPYDGCFADNYSRLSVFCYTTTPGNRLPGILIPCTRDLLKNLISFLDIKKIRVEAFKQSFNESIEGLSQMNGKEGVNTFIELLALYKDLLKSIALMCESEIRRPASQILQDLSSMYQIEANRKPTYCILKHLS
jgi:hypothetical protein